MTRQFGDSPEVGDNGKHKENGKQRQNSKIQSIGDKQDERGGEMNKKKMPRINPHASVLKQDNQLKAQIKWLKENGFKSARDAQNAGY